MTAPLPRTDTTHLRVALADCPLCSPGERCGIKCLWEVRTAFHEGVWIGLAMPLHGGSASLRGAVIGWAVDEAAAKRCDFEDEWEPQRLDYGDRLLLSAMGVEL